MKTLPNASEPQGHDSQADAAIDQIEADTATGAGAQVDKPDRRNGQEDQGYLHVANSSTGATQ